MPFSVAIFSPLMSWWKTCTGKGHQNTEMGICAMENERSSLGTDLDGQETSACSRYLHSGSSR